MMHSCSPALQHPITLSTNGNHVNPGNQFVMNISCDKPYIFISPLVIYKILLLSAMYSRLAGCPSISLLSALSEPSQ